MDFSKLQQDIVSLQSKVNDEMAKVQEMAAQEPQLPKPSGNFLAAQKLVADHNYEVVVCGEVKKGKSSFINALLGQRLLPVNSDVATAQVFRISDAPEESFRLVFTDGTDKPISKEELVTYGSQVSYNLQGEPGMEGKLIDYIEVKTPARFLPKGVNIVDTPGLGALYRSHEAITRGYVRKAAAVIFVLDFEAPIGEQEKKFINDVLDVTPYVIFVATKSDLYNGETRKLLLDRNNHILSDIYAARNLQAPKIRPFSSEVLISAAEVVFGGEEAELQSGYKKVAEDVQRLIYKSVGLLRTGNALIETGQFVNKVNSVIADILTASRNDGIQAQKDLEEKKRNLQLQLQNKFGEDSSQQREIQAKVNAICDSLISKAAILSSTSGDVYRSYCAKIDTLDSVLTAKQDSTALLNSAAVELSNQWKNMSLEAIAEVESLLADFQDGVDNFGISNSCNLTVRFGRDYSRGDYLRIFRDAAGGAFATLAVVNILFNPAAWIAILITIAGGILFGKEAILNKVRSAAKSQLANEIMADAQQKIVPLARELSSQIRMAVSKTLESSLSLRKTEIQEELNDLIERGQMDIEEKKREFQRWTAIQGEWSNEVDEVRKLIDIRNQLSKELNS